MSIEESLIKKLRALPPEKQQEALRFVESLQRDAGERRVGGSLNGMWAGLGVDVTAEDIDQARHEVWRSFPRKDVQ